MSSLSSSCSNKWPCFPDPFLTLHNKEKHHRQVRTHFSSIFQYTKLLFEVPMCWISKLPRLSEAVFRSDTLSDRFSHCYGRVDECTFADVWEELKISLKVGDQRKLAVPVDCWRAGRALNNHTQTKGDPLHSKIMI